MDIDQVHSCWNCQTGINSSRNSFCEEFESLSKRQESILSRIAEIEVRVDALALLPRPQCEGQLIDKVGSSQQESESRRIVDQIPSKVQLELEKLLIDGGVKTFRFLRVPSNYYEESYEVRRDLLGADSVDHLCKSIVMVNTQASADVVDCSNPKNSKYYMVISQYSGKFNAEKVKNFVYSLNEGKIPKKRFNMRLAPEAVSDELTGYIHNSVTPIGMKTKIPVILSAAIVNLKPEFFWLGGGEVDLKLGVSTKEFIKFVDPFIVDCS